jgi:hypothetical protein
MVARRLRGVYHSSMEAGRHHNIMDRQNRTITIKEDMELMTTTEAMEDMDKIMTDNTTTLGMDEGLRRNKTHMGQDPEEAESQRQEVVEDL